MSITYKVKGLDKFLRTVKQKGKNAEVMVDRELNRSALRIERKAKYYSPWDTGFMSMSIFSHKVGNLQWEVSSPAEYSIYVELGTRRQNPQPFLYPAVEEEFPILMDKLKRMFSM
ncbi:HK97-gp10 family putative phage morphogenesis protein [Aerococcus urinaeequi]